tara:strand:+ start:2594 stop:3283 length:690 start_codon:yes stop_codon:yes gene_type:complete
MFTAIVPLRSGSKGIKNKNLVSFKNHSLANFTIKKLLKIKLIDKIYILTDSVNYKKKIIKNKKIDLNYIRPKNLSKKNSSIYDLIDNFLSFQEKHKKKMEKILLFQVTSPLLKKREIIETLKFIKKKRISSLFHISKMIEAPEDCIKGKGINWRPLNRKRKINRQNYFKNYNFITGSLFYFTKDFFKKNKVTYNKSSYAYEVDKINFVDIDTSFDLEIAKNLINQRIRN